MSSTGFTIDITNGSSNGQNGSAPPLRNRASTSSLAPPTTTSSGFTTLRGSVATLVDHISHADKPGQDNSSIHNLLQGLRLDEAVTLAKSPMTAHTAWRDDALPQSFVIPLQRYIQYLYDTWSNILVITLHWELPIVDWLATVAFGVIASVILFFALLLCQFANNPLVYEPYFAFSRRYCHNLGLVNASDPKLFNALTEDQTNAAKKKLGTSIEETTDDLSKRVFDLDIAKFLLQIASIVYERKSDAIHTTINAINSTGKASLPASHRTPHYSAASRSAQRTTAHRPVNAPPGGQHAPSNAPTPGYDDKHTSGPGQLVFDLFEDGEVKKIVRAFGQAVDNDGEDVIKDFCTRMNIDYEPVSELNCSSSAFCSFFWDPASNWLVVAFKGTGAVEYTDWITDLTVTMVPSSDFIPSASGNAKAIKGFHDRLYPASVSDMGGTRPWDTIRYALCKVTELLAKQRAAEGKEGNINVWFTGHSLGCALASLAYTRIMTCPQDVAGYPITMRDCYIFAAPVAGNRDLATELNNTISKDAKLRTMWRIRNAGDAVATLLPQLGDRQDLVGKLSPTNPASFAHLGAEIIMKDGPILSDVNSPTEHLGKDDYGRVRVEVSSDFNTNQLADARKKVLQDPADRAREAFEKWAENIPLIGRFIAHDTVLYWDQLDRIAAGPVQWLTPRPQ